MISQVKLALAKAIKAGFDANLRIRTSNMIDERDGRPVPQMEVSVVYAGSSNLTGDEVTYFQPRSAQSSYFRLLNYTIILRMKNLRTEDEIQDFTDAVISILSASVIFQQHVNYLSDTPIGYVDGIWEYQIQINIAASAYLMDDCKVDWEALEVAEIDVYLHTTGTPENLKVKVASVSAGTSP